ncbi:hypothetical protein, partial [Acidisphaera sp. L21]|uniref:hypothetical protein n=1 Tax=Acidisphaera sp. L21 TaxID=1641851 RepID=UPI001C2096F5
SGSKAVTIQGTLAQVNAALATVTDAQSATGTDTIKLAAVDGFGNAAANKAVALTVNGLPVIAAPATVVAGVGKSLAVAGLSLSET